MTTFTVDPDIARGYRHRADAALLAIRSLAEAARAARDGRNELLSTARRRTHSGAKPQTSGGDPEALDWLTETERARFDKITAEIARDDADLAAAERAGAYARSIGHAVADHLKTLERAEEARTRAENGRRPALMEGTDIR